MAHIQAKIARTSRLGAASLAVLLISACGGGGQGTALAQRGSTSGITIWPTEHPEPGQVWDLAFPVLANRSGRTIHVNGFGVAHVPSGMKILGYRVLNSHETHGVLTTATPGDKDPKFDVRRFNDYSGRPITIPPKQSSPYYVLVEVKLTGRGRHDLTGCTVRYRTDGQEYRQTLGCDFGFHNPPRPGTSTQAPDQAVNE